MVIPLVSEKEWAHRLAGLPEWQPKFTDTIVVVPRPDDETLAACGIFVALRTEVVGRDSHYQ